MNTPFRTLLGATALLATALPAQFPGHSGSSHGQHGHGFTWTELSSAPFAAAGLIPGTAGAINDRGDVAGVASAAGVPTDSRGWILRNGSLTVFSAPNPGGVILEVTGLNDRGDCVGRYSDGPPTYNSIGFVRHADGTFVSLAATPDGNPEPEAINDHGEMVGDFGFQGTSGFVRTSGQTVPFALPGADRTTLVDANNHGWLLGRATAGSISQDFLMTQQGVHTLAAPDFTDRNPTAPFRLLAVNNRGDLAGSYRSTEVAFEMPLPNGGTAPTFAEQAFVRDSFGHDRKLEVPYLGSTDDLVVPPGPFGPTPTVWPFGGVSTRQVVGLSNRHALVQLRVHYLPPSPALPFTLSRTVSMIGERR